MGEKLYRYTIKDNGKTIALMDNIENVLIFLREKLGLLKEKKDRDDKFNKRH